MGVYPVHFTARLPGLGTVAGGSPCVNYCNAIIDIIAGILVFIFHHLWLNYGGPIRLGSIWFAACFASVCGGYRSGGVVCAQPIQIIQGQPFQPFGLVANAWVSWCGSVILLGGLVTIIFGDLFPDALLGVVVNGLSAVVSTMQHVSAQLNATPFPIPHPFHWLIGCGLMLLILAMVWPRLRALVMIQVTIVFLLSLIHLSQRCKVIAIDVDQGDATLVIDGFKSVLVDTGGIRLGGAYAKTHIYPVLNYYGIRQLDVLVLTHWDLDHVGGLPEIMARGVKHVISPVRPVPGHAVVHDKPQSISLPSGDIMLTPVSRFLHDPKSNHQALLVSIQLNDWSFLITGDIDQYAESLLIRLGQIHSHDVLKLGIMAVNIQRQWTFFTMFNLNLLGIRRVFIIAMVIPMRVFFLALVIVASLGCRPI